MPESNLACQYCGSVLIPARSPNYSICSKPCPQAQLVRRLPSWAKRVREWRERLPLAKKAGKFQVGVGRRVERYRINGHGGLWESCGYISGPRKPECSYLSALVKRADGTLTSKLFHYDPVASKQAAEQVAVLAAKAAEEV